LSTPNAAMREHWNQVVGPKWVGLSDQMDRHLQEVADLLLRHAAPKPGEAVLEIGSGTGSMAVRLAEAMQPGGHVLGIDISRPMTKAAEARIRAVGLSNVAFRVADAQTEPLPEGEFDLAFSRFGVMFFDDPSAAFTNIRRAMKKSGRLAFVCWGPLRRNPHWSIPLGVAVRHLGKPEPRPPHAPGPLAFDDPDYVRDLLTSAGWKEVTLAEATPTVVNEPLERAVEYAVSLGPTSALITEKNASEEVVGKIRAEIEKELTAHARDGKVRLPGLIYLVGARP
jgi:SAM-dependent methyltransferase